MLQRQKQHDPILQTNGLPQTLETEEVGFVDQTSIGSISIDGNPRSDTELGKQDSTGGRKDSIDGQEQFRPYVVKKSASFKPVSVTKSFLAKAGAPATMTSKPSGDKGIVNCGTSIRWLIFNSEWNDADFILSYSSIGTSAETCCEVNQWAEIDGPESYKHNVEVRKRRRTRSESSVEQEQRYVQR